MAVFANNIDVSIIPLIFVDKLGTISNING
jgi:hypothetical protein